MAYGRNRFVNPGTGETYHWPVNHSEEERMGQERAISYGAPTANTGLIRHQGDRQPMILTLNGVIFHRDHYSEMIRWFARCERQSIHFYDFTGEGYEVIILAFQPQRVRTLRNPRDPAIPLHYWRYTMTMDVLTFLTAGGALWNWPV